MAEIRYRTLTFTIRLPSVPPPLAEEPSEPRPPELAGGHERVLVVEDDATVRGLAVRALEVAGYTVLSASDGEEADRLVAGADDGINLVLSDIIMPGARGDGNARSAR